MLSMAKVTLLLNAMAQKEKKLQKIDLDLAARKAIGGDAEGGQETKPVSKEVKKANDAADYFKDTALGDAIKKANE